jgi:ParB family chromosome partitioning protein
MNAMAERRPGRGTKGPSDGARLPFTDPSKKQSLEFALIPAERLEVIKHQRKPSDPHVGRVTTSIERIGFLAPLVVVEQDGAFVILDGQHRFLAAKALGLKELPVVIVPPELACRMLSLNVEKEPNIRERSAVALSIYRELVETTPDLSEDEAEVADSVDHAHYVTLGLGYEESGRLAGSAFEPILNKCDGFLDQPLSKSYEVRQERAATVVEANSLVRAVADKLKELGTWHQFVGAQIIGYANPLKRTRKQSSFDSTFEKMIDKLHELTEHPEKALHASAE